VAEPLRLAARRRTVLGKKSRFLRRQGIIPANLYGPGAPSEALQLNGREIETLLTRAGGTTLVNLAVEGEEPVTVLVKGVQRHPVSDALLHVDLYRVRTDRKLRTEVPLHFIGESPGVRAYGGAVMHALSHVTVECLPADLPPHIPVDLGRLVAMDDQITVGDLLPPDSPITILTPAEELVAKLLPPAVEAEVEEEAPEAAEVPTVAEQERSKAEEEEEE